MDATSLFQTGLGRQTCIAISNPRGRHGLRRTYMKFVIRFPCLRGGNAGESLKVATYEATVQVNVIYLGDVRLLVANFV